MATVAVLIAFDARSETRVSCCSGVMVMIGRSKYSVKVATATLSVADTSCRGFLSSSKAAAIFIQASSHGYLLLSRFRLTLKS